jgi:hypothetical protein
MIQLFQLNQVKATAEMLACAFHSVPNTVNACLIHTGG